MDKSALAAEYYAGYGSGVLADESVDADGADARVAYQPAGLVVAVMPWNLPVQQGLRLDARAAPPTAVPADEGSPDFQKLEHDVLTEFDRLATAHHSVGGGVLAPCPPVAGESPR